MNPDIVIPLKSDKEEDASGLNCPLPILRAKKALAAMESGQILKVIATDVSSVGDFAAFARQTGHVLLRQEEPRPGQWIHWLQHR